jgi:DNA topoisomerase IB
MEERFGCKIARTLRQGGRTIAQTPSPKKELGGGINKPKPTEKELAERWDKKKNQISNLIDNIQKLRYNLTRNINGATNYLTNKNSTNEKIFLTSLVISLMDETGERVGNEESASNGHFGITGLKKKHITINGNKVKLKYVGKSGVEHEVEFTNEKIANALKQAMANTLSEFVFETSEGFKIKADRVNRFLSDYNVTAKDLRGYSANKWVIDKLNKLDAGKDEKQRKKQFNEIVKKVASDIGHGRATLKNHYLLPELEPNFVERSKIIKLNEN